MKNLKGAHPTAQYTLKWHMTMNYCNRYAYWDLYGFYEESEKGNNLLRVETREKLEVI